MDENIISSAKKIILDQKSQNDHDNDKIEKLEAKLRIYMEQLNEKLTKLTTAL